MFTVRQEGDKVILDLAGRRRDVLMGCLEAERFAEALEAAAVTADRREPSLVKGEPWGLYVSVLGKGQYAPCRLAEAGMLIHDFLLWWREVSWLERGIALVLVAGFCVPIGLIAWEAWVALTWAVMREGWNG